MRIYECKQLRLERYISATSRVYHVERGHGRALFVVWQRERKTQLLLNVLDSGGFLSDTFIETSILSFSSENNTLDKSRFLIYA
jgi:hypothetical protein